MSCSGAPPHPIEPAEPVEIAAPAEPDEEPPPKRDSAVECRIESKRYDRTLITAGASAQPVAYVHSDATARLRLTASTDGGSVDLGRSRLEVEIDRVVLHTSFDPKQHTVHLTSETWLLGVAATAAPLKVTTLSDRAARVAYRFDNHYGGAVVADLLPCSALSLTRETAYDPPRALLKRDAIRQASAIDGVLTLSPKPGMEAALTLSKIGNVSVLAERDGFAQVRWGVFELDVVGWTPQARLGRPGPGTGSGGGYGRSGWFKSSTGRPKGAAQCARDIDLYVTEHGEAMGVGKVRAGRPVYPEATVDELTQVRLYSNQVEERQPLFVKQDALDECTDTSIP